MKLSWNFDLKIGNKMRVDYNILNLKIRGYNLFKKWHFTVFN